MKQRLSIALVAVLVSVVAYLGVSKYEQYRFIESITPPVKNASLRMMNAARFETEGSSITYKELFEKLEGDIAEIDKRILDVQTLSTQSNKDVIDPVVDYLRGGQDLLRSLLVLARKDLAHDFSARRAMKLLDAIADAKAAPVRAYATKLADEARQDWKIAAQENVEARLGVARAANSMKPLIDKISDQFPRDVLLAASLSDAIAKKYEKSNK